jgi:altronate hydrolase
MDLLSRALKLDDADNVAIARDALAERTALDEFGGLVVRAHIPAAHNIAIRRISAGEAVRRYGQTIGFAMLNVAPGDHVHTHDLSMGPFGRD